MYYLIFLEFFNALDIGFLFEALIQIKLDPSKAAPLIKIKSFNHKWG